MDAVKEWGINICLALIAGGIVHMMAPSSSMGKTLKVTVSAFLILSIFSPLTLISGGEISELFDSDSGISERAYENGYEDVSEKINEQMLLSSENTLKRIIVQHLEEFEIYDSDVEVKMSFDDSGQIIAESIIIEVEDEYIDSKYAITERLKQQLGIDCDVREK